VALPEKNSARRRRRTGGTRESSSHAGFDRLVQELATTGRDFYARGWVQGTSGNFSAVLSHQPLRLVLTASGLDKRILAPEQFLEIDAAGKVLRGAGRPSSEAMIHLAIVRQRDVGAVLHTHSIWNTILSEAPDADGIALEGYEMLKGLEGVRTHEHTEWLPILENSQDMARLAKTVETSLAKYPAAHGLLLRKHGLYTWGRDLAEARRHVEIFEFLMEVLGRRQNRTHELGGSGR
jgi:methylthioribulose-1-phosphate dehydratase